MIRSSEAHASTRLGYGPDSLKVWGLRNDCNMRCGLIRSGCELEKIEHSVNQLAKIGFLCSPRVVVSVVYCMIVITHAICD